MPSRTLNRSRQVGLLSVPSGLHDTTTILDDIGLLALGNADTYQTNKDKYQTIIAGNWSAMLSLPGQELVYSSGLQVEDSNPVELGKVTARAGGYLAHNSAGAEIPYFAGGNGLICDSGNVGFQNDTATLILNWLAGAGAGVNGIFFDNFIMDITSVGASYPVYSQGWNGTSGGSLIWNNRTDFQNALISFITNVGTKLKNAGYAVVVNARGVAHVNDIQDDNGTTTNSWMDRYYPYVTGMMVEYWQQDGSNRTVELTGDDAFNHHWDGWQSVIAKCNTVGIGPYPLSYTGSETNELANQDFLRASFLMEWDGRHGCWLTGSDVGAFTPADAWSTSMARDVGQPQSAKVAVGSCWKRQYEHYLVYVNPTQSTQTPDGHSMASGTALFL